MATEIITGLNGGVALTATAAGDTLPISDVSDTTEAATGTTKPIAMSDLLRIVFTSLALSGDISPAQITSNQNDYSPTGLADASVLRLSTDASRNITSIAGGADGRVLLIHNVGSFNIVLKDDDGATGTAANRFALSADITLLPDQSALIQYDSTTSRWRMVAGPPAPGAGGVGDVVGPGSATDNALVRFDSTTGKLIQNSTVTLDDTGAITVPEMSAPSTPAANKVAIYAKSDGKLYIKDDAGTETDLTTTGGAPSGSAGGDLSGTYPNPTVIKVSLTGAHGSDDTWTGTTIAGLNAGATIAQWEAVYLDSSSTWQLADANGAGTYPARGLATAAYVNTDPAIILVHGTVRNDAWNWNPGGAIYLSGTAGALTQTAPSTSGDKVQQVGFALTADIAFFDFNSTFLTVT